MRMKTGKWYGKKERARLRLQILVLFLVLLLLILFLSWNASTLHQALIRSTEQYVEDVSAQLASHINSRMEADIRSMEQLADSVPRLPEGSIEPFLERQARLLELEELVLMGTEGGMEPADPVTGGMNNAAFLLECQKLVASASPASYTLVMMNVKGFKLVNENFGTGMGDRSLKHIYRTLKEMVQKEAVARGEADHFFLCLARDADVQYFLNISQGACPIEQPDAELMLMEERARIAGQLWQPGSPCVFYSAELAEQLKAERELSRVFETALKEKQFTILMQPKIRLEDEWVGGAETLVRWVHPERGVISPADSGLREYFPHAFPESQFPAGVRADQREIWDSGRHAGAGGHRIHFL